MSTRFPARLHAVLASQAPVGVVFRRGPAKSVCSVLWDRATDRFTLGQWLRGRIYERRADISPDGKHLIYFAMNGRWHSSETRGSWTAISRVPWLKAETLHGKGDCWQGGGLFLSNSQYWLNGGDCHFPVRDAAQVRWDRNYQPFAHYGGECLSVYYVRLQRDGWKLKRLQKRSEKFSTFEKELPKGWILRKLAHADVVHPPGAGCYWDEHEMVHPKHDRYLPFPEWEWAELDGKTLVWAEKGCLYRAPLYDRSLGPVKVLYDFNEMTFERRIAPY